MDQSNFLQKQEYQFLCRLRCLAVLPYFYSLSVGEGVLISKMNILVGKKTCLLSVPQVFNNKLTFNNKLRAERDFSVFL